MATIGLAARREPARVRHRHHPRGRLASSASSRSRRGARCSATPSTPASSCSSPRSSTTSTADRPVDFSSEVFPALLADGQAALRRGRRGLLGGRRHARGLRARPQGRPRRQGRASTSPASSSTDGVWLGEGAEIHPDAAGRRARPSSATNCRVEAGARLGEYTVLGANVRVRGEAPTSSAPSSTTTPTSARACASAARSSGGRATCAAASAARRASVLGDECFVGERRRLGAGVKVYPFKTVEAGRRRQLLDRLGVARAPAALFGRDGVAGLANVDITPELAARVAMAYGTTLKKGSTVVTSRDSSRSARMLKRAMMAGLNAGGRQRARPRGGVGAGHPLPRPLARGRRRRHGPAASHGDPQSVVIRFFDSDGARHHRGRPAQDRAPVPPGGLPPGVRRPRSATSASRPGPSSSTPPRSRPPSTSRPIRGGRLQGRGRLRYGSTVVRHAQRAGQARRRRAGGQPLRLHRRARSTSTATPTPSDVAGLVRASGAHLGAVSTPTASASRSSTTRATSSPTPRRCWPS